MDSIFTNPTISFKYANQIIHLSKEKDYSVGTIKGYNLIGLTFKRNTEFDSAEHWLNKAVEIAKRDGKTKELGLVLYNLASVYNEGANYEKSLSAVIEALNIAMSNLDSPRVARCYRLLAECFFNKGDIKQAVKYANNSVNAFRALNNLKSLSSALIARALILIEDGNMSAALSDLVEAKHITNQMKDQSALSTIYLNLGFCFDRLHKIDSAIYYYKKAIVISNVTNERIIELVSLNNLGEIYLNSKNYDLAEAYLIKGVDLAKKVNSFLDLKMLEGGLSRLYFETGEYKKAYIHQGNYIIYSDSIFNEQKMKAIEELSVKFQTKEIKEQNKLLETELELKKIKDGQRNLYIYVILISCIFILILIFFYVRKKQIMNSIKTNELKQKLLLSQMNPHFIFNSLDNIQSLIYNNQNTDAIKYLTKFSKLTRQILENSIENYITLSEEIEMLDHYLTIQRLLYNNKFTYNIRVDQSIEQENILIPPMLSQPFIENAIKHGLKHKKDDGVININFSMKNEVLIFEVTDNGSGLEGNKESTHHKSVSTKIIKERLAHQNNKKSTEIRIENIRENNIVMGVRVLFEIPYIYNN